MKNPFIRAAGLLLASCTLAACEKAEAEPARTASPATDGAPAAVWQLAPAALLAAGGFGGIMAVRDVQRHGDLGLAGADALDGEMVLLDGQFYQFLANGQVVQPSDTMRLPFAAVTFWEGGRDVPVQPGLVYDDSGMPAIDTLLPGLNSFYAVRMEGTWDTLVVRTFRRQIPPYPPIDSAVHHQAVDTLLNARGTMVGFRQPAFASGMSLPNYHLHFISEDRTRGGHALAFTVRDVRLQVSERPEFTVHMPPGTPLP